VAGIGALWGLVVLIGILALMRRSRGRLETGLDDAGWRFSGLWEPLVWLGLSLAWTWPAALAGPDRLVGRHFDTHGTIWTIDAAPRLIGGLVDPQTCWPLGAEYGGIDSFVLLPVATVFHFIGAVRLHAWLGILGVAASAWAASGLARAMGARRPWSLIAGGIFAFSGLAASALLEGHVYHVMNPWLPLMLWALWLATGAGARPIHGILAGLCFALTLLTTGYLGVAAAIIGIGVLAGALVARQRAALMPAVSFVAIALPVGLIYLSMFSGGADVVAGYASPETLRMGSISMASIGLPSAEVDRVGHSWAMVLSPVGVGLALLSPWVLGRDPRRYALLISGVIGLGLAMGPDLVVGMGPNDPAVRSPLGWIWDLPGGNYLRFPGRIAWAWNLVAGVLAALVAHALAAQVGRRARWVLIAVAIEAFLLVGLPLRQVSRSASAPAVLSVADGPIFSLLPEGTNPNGEVDSWLSAMGCLHQVEHGQAIADDCVSVPATSSPRAQLGRYVGARILEGKGQLAFERLASMGFSAVAWHPDLVHPSTGYRVEGALSDLQEIRPSDGLIDGRVRLYQLPEVQRVEQALPESEPATGVAIGQSTVEHWQPRIGLSVPPALLGSGRYFVRIKPAGQKQKQLELKDDGGPGDWVEDGLLTAGWQGAVHGGVEMSVWSVHDGEWTSLWSGPVQPVAGPEDPLVFRLDPSGAHAAPIVAAMDTFAPEVNHRGGYIHLLGWGLFGLIFVLGIRSRRR
jgi:hypothetical protein